MYMYVRVDGYHEVDGSKSTDVVDQYSPKPIEVRVRIKSEEIEDYVYQCYENSQMERAEIMVNIHMGARCMR